jgi:perosamine synthetase
MVLVKIADRVPLHGANCESMTGSGLRSGRASDGNGRAVHQPNTVNCAAMSQAIARSGQLSKIHYSKPSITRLELELAADAAANGWAEHCYDYLVRFEREFASWLGVRHTVATSGATGALHMGLAALDIKPGDEVILADINWIASAGPITYLGAKPVFVDILEDTWCLDPERVEAAITPRTRAIMAVHLYGSVADMDALLDIGRRHGIPVIEDAAEAMGSRWKDGRRTGTMGAWSAFSFHGAKTMTTAGEGGMFATDDDALAWKVRAFNSQGRVPGQKKQFWPDMIGYKYRMSNVQAAFGCGQLQRIEQLIERRREIAFAYRERLAGLPLAFNVEPPGTVNCFWMPTIVVDADVRFDREALIADMTASNIDARVFFWPLSMLPMFERRPDNVVSYSIHGRAMNLPSYNDITEDDLDRVCEVVRRHV